MFFLKFAKVPGPGFSGAGNTFEMPAGLFRSPRPALTVSAEVLKKLNSKDGRSEERGS